jgi:hypothetical protein
MKTLSTLLALSLLLAASPVPRSGSAYAAPQKTAENPGVTDPGSGLPGGCPGLKCVDDPVQRSLIERLIQWVRDALHGGHNLMERLRQLLRDLAAYLKKVRGEIREQTESSNCRDRACQDYGTKP